MHLLPQVATHNCNYLQGSSTGWANSENILILSRICALHCNVSQLGGYHSKNTTEILGGGPSFSLLAPRAQHCSIQVNWPGRRRKMTNKQIIKGESVDNGGDWRSIWIRVIGGWVLQSGWAGQRSKWFWPENVFQFGWAGQRSKRFQPGNLVWQVTRKELAPLVTGRWEHACASYTVGQQLVLLHQIFLATLCIKFYFLITKVFYRPQQQRSNKVFADADCVRRVQWWNTPIIYWGKNRN